MFGESKFFKCLNRRTGITAKSVSLNDNIYTSNIHCNSLIGLLIEQYINLRNVCLSDAVVLAPSRPTLAIELPSESS